MPSKEPSRTKLKNAAIAAKSAALPKIPKELLDQIVAEGPMTAKQINATTMALKKALIERALGGELSHHLGYAPGAARPEDEGNQRNGSSAKTVHTEGGPLRIEVPRDREGSFEPLLIGKHERRFTGFDDKIVAMYARGMTVREIQGFLAEQYGTEVSAEFISSQRSACSTSRCASVSTPSATTLRPSECASCTTACTMARASALDATSCTKTGRSSIARHAACAGTTGWSSRCRSHRSRVARPGSPGARRPASSPCRLPRQPTR